LATDPVSHPGFVTAGLTVQLDGGASRLYDAVTAASGCAGADFPEAEVIPDVTLSLERVRHHFDTAGGELVTRGVWATDDGGVVIGDVGGSGYSQQWLPMGDRLHVRTRWTPTTKARLAARLLPTRFRALQAQVLLHYPVLWWASVRGGAPLHVSVIEVDGVAVVLAGPGGVGKSTLVAGQLEAGATATCDNLAMVRGGWAHGLSEPLRLEPRSGGEPGRRTTHGRRELPWSRRAPALRPQLVVVLRRGDPSMPSTRPIGADEAVRGLVAGTYAAGELQRFWPLCAVLALATGRGPVHPPVEDVARDLCDRLPCFEVSITGRSGASLSDLLHQPLNTLQHQGALP
jgi:hypothetical protein